MKLALSAAAIGLAALAGIAATAQTPAQHAGAAQAPAGTQAGAGGADLFEANCSACHQPMGEGIEGAFPKLAGNSFVVGDPKAVAATLLNGRGGMPSFRDDLSDAQLSAVSSFIRASWGNHATAIATESRQARKANDRS